MKDKLYELLMSLKEAERTAGEIADEHYALSSLDNPDPLCSFVRFERMEKIQMRITELREEVELLQ